MSSTALETKDKSEEAITKLTLEVKAKKEATKIGDLSSTLKDFFLMNGFVAEHSINEIVNFQPPLYLAFQQNCPKFARELLEYANITLDYVVPENANMFRGYNALATAIYYSTNQNGEDDKARRESVRIMLDKNPSLVNFVYPCGVDPGYTPLMHAAARGDVHIMEMLIAAGADIHHQRPDAEFWPGGQTHLHLAANNGSYEAVVFLLRCGVRADIKDREFNETALDVAKRVMDLAHPQDKYFVEVRTKIIKVIEDYESFFKVCREGDCKRAEELLQSSCHVTQIDSNGDTPLHHAVRGNQKEMVQLLVERGADLTLKNKEGFTAVDLAVKLHSDQKLAKFMMNLYPIQREMMRIAIGLRAIYPINLQKIPIEVLQFHFMPFYQNLKFSNQAVTNPLIHEQIERSIDSGKVIENAGKLREHLMSDSTSPDKGVPEKDMPEKALSEENRKDADPKDVKSRKFA